MLVLLNGKGVGSDSEQLSEPRNKSAPMLFVCSGRGMVLSAIDYYYYATRMNQALSVSQTRASYSSLPCVIWPNLPTRNRKPWSTRTTPLEPYPARFSCRRFRPLHCNLRSHPYKLWVSTTLVPSSKLFESRLAMPAFNGVENWS